jgi:hypothetical protein
MGQISVTGLTAKDPRVVTFVVEVYADGALTNLLDVLTAPATYDPATGIASMIGIMTFTGLTAGMTYYLQSCSVIPGFGRGDFSSVYSIAAGVDSGGSSGGVTFGSGPPSGSSTDGTIYFDTSATNYTMYVYHSSAWHLVGTSAGGSGVFSSGSNSNGYWVQDPAGNIRQWGVVTVDINSGTHVVTFPTAFASATGVSVVVSTKSSTDRITYVVDGSVSTTSFTIGNNGSSGFAYWEANGPGTTSGGGTILVDPSTTEGDILYRHSGAIARLGIGASGKFLKSNGTDPAWGDVPVLVGDTGSGGTAGLVPAPAAGDAAAGKFLKADGGWSAPSSSGGGMNYQGLWSGGTAYAVGDVVEYLGEAYLRLIPGGSSAPALVQSAKWTGTGTNNLAFPSPVTAGDLLIVALSTNGVLVPPTDTVGTPYVLKSSVSTSGVSAGIYAGIAPSSGSNSVLSGVPGAGSAFVISEFSDASSTVDASGTSAATSLPNSASITTTIGPDLVYAVSGVFGTETFTAGTGFTLLAGSPSDAQADEYGVKSAPGTYSVGFSGTGTASQFPLVVVAFASSTALPPLADPVSWLLMGLPSGAANKVLASPNGSSGVAALRSLVAADLPSSGVTSGSYTDANITVNSQGLITSASNGTGGGGGGALTMLEAHSFSGVSAIAFTSWYSSSYDEYIIEILGLVPSGSAGVLQLQVSANGGTSYDTASHYSTSLFAWSTGGSAASGVGTSTSMVLFPINGRSLSAVSNQSVNGRIHFYNPASSSIYQAFIGDLLGPDSANTTTNPQNTSIRGYYFGLAAFNALKLLISSGTFSGTVRIYGVGH